MWFFAFVVLVPLVEVLNEMRAEAFESWQVTEATYLVPTLVRQPRGSWIGQFIFQPYSSGEEKHVFCVVQFFSCSVFGKKE